MKRLKIWSQVFLSLVITLVITLPTAALTDQQWLMFNKNQINYWNPQGFASGCVSGSNTIYSGATVFSDAEINAVTANQPIYEAAAEKYGLNWQIIAALHYKESSFQRTNLNAQGVYQLYSYTAGGTNSNSFLPLGPISETEFVRQTDIAANFVSNLVTNNRLDINKADDIKRLFYLYNGISDRYYQKAINMGFTAEQARNGEGSPYVMNRYDEQRDPRSPNVSPFWAGTYTSDGVYTADAITDRLGAYVVYVTLGGEGMGSSGYCIGGENLVPGGMTLEQAKAFMAEYRSIQPSEWGDNREVGPYNINATTCPGGDLANCVAFTQYFINRYTTYSSTPGGIGGIGNGGGVVSNLLSRTNGGFSDGGTTPRAYAIFSKPEAGANGHTGVVLGINTETNEIIIGEAGCGAPFSWIDAHVYNLSTWSDGSRVYAYTDGILNL